MNVASVSSASSGAAAYLAQHASTASSSASTSTDKTKSAKAGNDPASIKKAAAQFEAIILRQLLSPAIDPIMSGGVDGGKSDAGGGGGVYGFMLTDTLATSLSKGGGLGLASMLEKQFAPRASSPALTTSAALKANPLSTPST